MGALFLIADGKGQSAPAALAAAEAQFARHGLTKSVRRTFPGWQVLHAPFSLGGPECFHADGDDFVAIAGTFAFDGAMGRAALKSFLAAASLPAIDWTRIAGQFICLLRKDGRTFLFTDFFGSFHLYYDAKQGLFSTSMLAALGALPKASFDAQGVYEYAFNIAPIGGDTVFAELKRLGPGGLVELTEQGSIVHPLSKAMPFEASDMGFEERIKTSRDRLMAVVEAHLNWFGDRVNAPLSGGLDSRLLLAALRAGGANPHSYVYGPEASEDVVIARQIGAAQGFEVEWVDKAGFQSLDSDGFAAQVLANFHECDALPSGGDIFDNGGHAMARAKIHLAQDGSSSALAASGGCGEVYRDFFYMANRPTSAYTLAKSFFARYNRGDVTGAFDEQRFLTNIEDKILEALGRAGDRGPLPRLLIEQAYPRVRAPAFFGREISLVGQQGAYLMPFLDHALVADAMTLPMPLKQAGTFEAALLTAIDPALAALPSAYGHDFTTPPSFKHRMGEFSTRMRPAWVRQRSYELQRRLRPGGPRGGYLAEDFMGKVIDLGFPAMRRFFQMEAVNDAALWQRIAAMEHLAKHLGAKLQPA